MKNNIENIYPLTPLQKGILYHNLVEENSSAYFEQMEFELNGTLNITYVEEALNQVIENHEILRTAFIYKQTKEPKQVVLNSRKSKVIYTDLHSRSHSVKDLDETMKEFKIQDRKKLFDLVEDCLIRMTIYRTGEDKYRMILSFHHIILDGWSIGIFFKEFFTCYKNLAKGISPGLNLNNGFSGYAGWLEQLDKSKAEAYWGNYVKGYDQKIKIGKELGRTNQRSHIPEMAKMEIGETLTTVIDNLAKELRVPQNTIYETAWGLLLSKFNNSNDVIFGKIVSGRNVGYGDIESTIGLFINTIPKRIRYSGEIGCKNLIKEVSNSNYEASEFEYLELNQIQGYSDIKKDLINHIFVYENYPIENAFSESEDEAIGFTIKYLDSFEQTNYDLTVIIAPADNASVIIRYNAQVFEREFVEKIMEHYINCLAKLADGIDKRVNEIDFILERESDRILNGFNLTTTAYPRDQSLFQIFRDIALKYPQDSALKYKGIELSYGDLLETADRYAVELVNRNIKKGNRVGLLLDDSSDMIGGILGILKIGAAYVPIDRNLPESRIRYIIEDSGISILIHEQEQAPYQDIVTAVSVKELSDCMESGGEVKLENLRGDEEVCIIYTSGTTGMPKGTSINSRNISRVVLNTNYVDIQRQDIMLQTSNYSFDGSFFNIFGSLLNGATLVLIDKEELLEMDQLSKTIEEEDITLFFMTTSLFNVMVTTIGEALRKVRCIVIGGEVASAKHCKKALEYMEKGQVINGYGPTESTVFASAFIMRAIKDTSGTIPIGKVLSNTKIYIVDQYNHLQPVGVEGELCIAGDGIANGYMNNKALTIEKFCENPFESGVLYRTGDIAKWREDGNIEYCGRRDAQVKIRGYRVELEEIENQLMKNKKLKEVAVIAKENNLQMKELALFYTVTEPIDKTELRQWLQKLVPSYMVPKYFIQLEELSLNKNGKIDKSKLREYEINTELSSEEENQNIEVTETEQRVMDVWNSILMTKNISVNDDFYEIGGDSIKAILIYTELQKVGYKLAMKDIVQYPTIRELSERIEKRQGDQEDTAEDKIILLNEESRKKLVLFPAFLPKFANQIMGKLLLEHIKDYSIYIAEFFEVDNLYSLYADMLMNQIRPDDEVVFMGYSFGGNIAYEVAKELEGRGITIKNIIYIDSYRLDKFWFADPSDLKIEVNKFFEEYIPMNEKVNLEEFQNEMFNQMSTYCNFINDYVGVYPEIEASMHMILSNEEVKDENDVRLQWENSSKGQYNAYQGFGTHTEMWRNDFLPKNLEIITRILDKI